MLSFIVTNHNYGHFLTETINSVLRVRWPDKEVIVVDDGSTDDSRERILAFGDNIIPIFKERGGQNSAANAGFARSTGEIVFFVDSDDTLDPNVAQAVMSVFSPGVVKVQFPQRHIDALGHPLGTIYPRYTDLHSPLWAKTRLRKAGFYDGAPTSGNAWPRWFLNEVFPLPTCPPDEEHRYHFGFSFDAYLILLSPYFGDVISLTTPLGSYRIHDDNYSQTGRFNLAIQCAKCCEELECEEIANALLKRKGKITSPSQLLNIERWDDHIKRRLMCKRLMPHRYPRNDTLLSLFPKWCRAVWNAECGLRHKGVLLVWGSIMVFAPLRMAEKAAETKENSYRRAWPNRKVFKQYV
jgi:glycosyltransferase involved in cell wall biosynthesis